MKFDAAMKKTCAVVNANIEFLHHFITNDKMLYSTYGFQVAGEIRIPARENDARRRKATDALIFGDYGDQIRYAALSLNGVGLKSYGSYSMRLNEIAIRNRATLLEENSFDFVERHQLTPKKAADSFPAGHRAKWQERHKLAVAKLAGNIKAATTESEYDRILLTSEGRHKTDKFIEIHIYGPFNNRSIEVVKGKSAPRNRQEKAFLAIVKEHLAKAGKRWEEE